MRIGDAGAGDFAVLGAHASGDPDRAGQDTRLVVECHAAGVGDQAAVGVFGGGSGTVGLEEVPQVLARFVNRIDVFALAGAMSIEPRIAPSIRAKAGRCPRPSTAAMFIATSNAAARTPEVGGGFEAGYPAGVWICSPIQDAANDVQAAAFFHELEPEAFSTAGGGSNSVRVHVTTSTGALDREQQLGLVKDISAVIAEAAGDSSLTGRTWVALTEAVPGGWGIGGTPGDGRLFPL